MDRVAGKVALVTGGAQGLGQAIAELLGREGAHVVISDIQEERGAAVAEGIDNASFLPHDVAVEADWERVIAEVVSARGGLHILVNNAGIALQKNVVDTTLEEWRQLQSINLDDVFLGVKHGIPAIAGSGGGSIVNLGGVPRRPTRPRQGTGRAPGRAPDRPPGRPGGRGRRRALSGLGREQVGDRHRAGPGRRLDGGLADS